MKNKLILISILLLCIVGVAYFFIDKDDKAGSSTPEVKVEMFEELSNGESKVVEPIYDMDEQTLKWLNKQEHELTTIIAKQLKVDRQDVMMKLAPIATGKDKMLDISCSVVLLKSEPALDDAKINKVVEDIIAAISNQQTVKATISEENIVITNSNHDVLH